MIENNGIYILDSFAECCDTCLYRPFGGGYSGRKNCGYCCFVEAVICRSNICDKYRSSEKAKRKSIGGMKGQSKWFKDDMESIQHSHKFKIKRDLYK